MLKIATLPIEATDTSASMYEKLAELGPEALIDCLADIAAGKAVPVKQDDELANYAKKLSKEEARINWNDDAAHIERCVRAFNPWPMSHFEAAENSINRPSSVPRRARQRVQRRSQPALPRPMAATFQPPGSSHKNTQRRLKNRLPARKAGRLIVNTHQPPGRAATFVKKSFWPNRPDARALFGPFRARLS